MRNVLLAILFFGMSTSLMAQEDTSTKQLQDVIIFANKFPTLSKNIVQRIGLITDKNLINQQANTADILSQSGQVFVQKSQLGGGSPVIRGFEASRVLLMVDGVRLNNAIFRAGHLQNIITIDNMILDRVEINYGPSSTLYGSDALGGVVNMYTKNPILNEKASWKTNTNLIQRYATGQNENRTHIDIDIANNKWAYLTSFTNSSFGNLRQGNNRSSSYPDFGKRFFYVERVNGTDVAQTNDNVNIQRETGYHQIDILQKVLYKPLENVEHLLNIQLSNSSNINRYDRLTETSNGAPVYAEWYYGPQKRNLISYKYAVKKLKGYFQDAFVIANYQNLEESRISRKFKSNNKDYRMEKVHVLGINADFLHSDASGDLHVGIESYNNFVNSTARRTNISTGALSTITTRYSDGPTRMGYHAIYAQQTKYLNNHLILNDGIRFNIVSMNAQFKDTSLMHFPFTEAKQTYGALTGNIGLAYNGENGYKVAFGLSSGFRAPNIDDLTKVFDTKTGYVVVPNPDLKPEYTYNTELNITRTMRSYTWGASVFYTLFKNAAVVDKFTFNGQNKIIYQGILSDVYAPQNKATAVVYGFNINGKIEVVRNTNLSATYTYTKGTYDNGSTSMPLDHIPPTYGRVGLKHGNTLMNVEVYAVFNGWKHMADYNLNGEDNEIYATKDGMPSWTTLNFVSYYNPSKKISIGFQVENITDLNYRFFASGISAVGRNFIVSCKIAL